MFDIGFLELFVVFVIGLLVIGPERLPGAIKTGALWFSRVKRSLRDARTEFEQQIGADEIRREIHNEQIMESLRAIEEARSAVDEKVAEIKKGVDEIADETANTNILDIDEDNPGGDTHAPLPENEEKNQANDPASAGDEEQPEEALAQPASDSLTPEAQPDTQSSK